jgi:hypothetical protein
VTTLVYHARSAEWGAQAAGSSRMGPGIPRVPVAARGNVEVSDQRLIAAMTRDHLDELSREAQALLRVRLGLV